MHRFLWTLTAFFSAAAVALAMAWSLTDCPAKRGPGAAVPTGGRDAWTYVWPEGKGFRNLPDRFNLPLVVTLTDSPDSAVRIVLHADAVPSERHPGAHPAAGVFVDVSRTGLRLGRLEGGVEIERWSSFDVLNDPEALDGSVRELAAGRPYHAGGPHHAGRPYYVELKRRGAELAVTVEGRLAVRASDSAFSGGRTALAFSGGAQPKLGRVVRLAEFPEFADDFMRTQDEPGPWAVESGEWVIETLPTPSMSANGFSYRGRSGKVKAGGAALVLAGNASWDQYHFSAAARGEPGEALGLVFAARRGQRRGPDVAARPGGRYVLFRWTSREKTDAVGQNVTGSREIVLVEPPPSGAEEGEPPVERVLARAPGGYIPGQWYRLEVELEFGRARAYVDGHELLGVRAPDLTSGLVGLWSSGEKGATFDDVLVAPWTSIEDDFGPAFAGTPVSPSQRRGRHRTTSAAANSWVNQLASSDELGFTVPSQPAEPTRLVRRVGGQRRGPDFAARVPGPGWEALGGEWVVRHGGLSARTRPGERDAKLLTGSPDWRRFTARVELACPGDGEAGIVANYRDEENYVLLKAEGAGRFSLERVRAGRRETLASDSGPDAGEIVLELRSDRGYLAGFVNGDLLLEGWDTELLEGRTGLWIAGRGNEEGLRFRGFRSELIPHRPPVNIVNAVFEADSIMAHWARIGADWYRTDAGPGRVAHWHRSPFHGDVELALDLPEDTPQTGRVVLGIAKLPDHPMNGYGWEFDFSPAAAHSTSSGRRPELHRGAAGAEGSEREAAARAPVSPKEARRSTVPSRPAEPTRLVRRVGGDEGEVGSAAAGDFTTDSRAASVRTLGDSSGPHGVLRREDAVVDEVTLDSGHRLESLFVRRQGRYVVAGVNGRPLVRFLDHDPLPGGRIAYLVAGVEGAAALNPRRVRLYGGLFFDYFFTSAPVEWRSAAGLWEVRRRWDCDRRWSFFVGRYDPEGPTKAAVAWNKRSFPGDVVVDFYVGPLMESGRGRKYEYIRDMNVTIAADGRDVASGYTFTFAGFGNKASAILRRDRIVAEDRSAGALLQRSMGIHQKWYHVRVERTGGLLRYTVDLQGRRVVDLQYEDPDPLRGDRVAVWTYDCGNVYARLRIAAGRGPGPDNGRPHSGTLEHPDFVPPSVTRTFYDGQRGDPQRKHR